MKAIAGINSDKITCEDLLSSGSFDLQYNDYHVITNVSRPELHQITEQQEKLTVDYNFGFWTKNWKSTFYVSTGLT